MPIAGFLHLLIAVSLAVHAMRTGRPQFWMYILIFVPLVGSIAYVVFEILPELAQSRRARQVSSTVSDIVDPDREWRRRHEAAGQTDSVQAKLALAEECERKGMWTDAIGLYRASATGMFADDPAVLSGLSRAELAAGDATAALATLGQLRAAHPEITHAEAHLLYARVLDAVGRGTEAGQEYLALMGYHGGIETRTRFGLHLLRCGEPRKARALFEDVARSADGRRIALNDAERDWVKVAKANL